MKKLLLSVLLLFVVCNCCYAAERFVVKSSTIKYHKIINTDQLTQIIRDTQTNQDYILIITDGFKSGGVAITPLIKPAVYVHKK